MVLAEFVFGKRNPRKVLHNSYDLYKLRGFLEALEGDYYSSVESVLKGGLLRRPLDPNFSIEDSNGFFRCPLEIACSKGHLRTVQVLLKYGALPSGVEGTGTTPLIVAVAYASGGQDKCFQLCKILLESGANVNRKNEGGASAIRYARSQKLNDVVILLRSFGARE